MFTIFATSAIGARIEGVVTVINEQKAIEITGHRTPYYLKSDLVSLRESFSKLKIGDYISGEGKFDVLNQSVKVIGIKYIGLNKLLGKWKSQNLENFHFSDYQTLYYSTPSSTQSLKPKATRTIRYHITPNIDNKSWPILFTDNFASGTGRVIVHGNKAYITLFNVSGKKVREISLLKQ